MVRVLRALRAVPLPLALVASVALTGVVLGRVYAGSLLTWLVVGAAAGSVSVSVVARRLRSWLVAPLSVAALAGFAAWSLRLTADAAGLSGSLAQVSADAARNAIPRLLTAMIPVEATPDTVLVPLVAAWLAGLAAAEVALRAGRVLLGFLPPALCYAGAVYVVGPNADPAVWPTVAFAAVAAIGLAVPAKGPGPTAPDPTAGLAPGVRAAVRVRLAASAAAGLVVVVGLAALLGPAVAARVDDRPVDPRRYVEPPRVESLDENPLIRISGWALHPEQKLLEVTTRRSDDPADGPADGAGPDDGGRSVRIRLAVLSDYDGVTWRVGATYRNAGRILPAAEPEPGATVETVRQEITVAELSGRLLPAVATPREVSGARVAYDPQTETLIRPEGLTPGLRYAVTSAVPRPDNNLLAMADVPAGEEVARVLRVADGVPDPVRRLAAQLAEENGAPYARAAAIEQFLAEHYRMVADAPSGHAYPNLNFFLFGPRNGGGQRGTSEQFAAAFAVLGRLTGLPTRVVVGFSSGGTGPVRAADAFAWPEVFFSGLGWVPFDPLPRPDDEPRPVEEDFRPKPEDPPPSEVPEPTVGPTATPEPVAGPGRPVESAGPPTALLVGIGAGGALLLVVAVLLTLLLMRRARTRARLERGDPGQRIAGAWREVTDALRLAGRPVGDDLSASEVAAHAGLAVTAAEPPGPASAPALDAAPGAATPPPVPAPDPAAAAPAPAGPTGAGSTLAGPADAGRALAGPAGDTAGAGGLDARLRELAGLLNHTAFAPGAATAEQAARAVATATEYVAALRAGLPWWRRLLWSVRPGPLRWPR